MKRWAGVVSGPGFTVERFARSVASHLLDAGFSASHLHTIIKARLHADTPEITLSEICYELHGQVSANARRPFEVLLAFGKPPRVAGGIPKNWLWGRAVSKWLVGNGFDTKDIRAAVGILLTVHARDSAGAAQAARVESDRFAARAIVATGSPLHRLPFLWVKGDKVPATLSAHSRGVRVEALYREGVIFSTTPSTEVDAAIELLSHLETSSPTAAIAGGWGAIEGLLADPGERATAADNLAALVACSLVRAELTTLSYKAKEEHAAVAAQLDPCKNNRERSRVMAQLIVEKKLPEMHDMVDRAAVLRVQKVLADPSAELMTIKDAAAEAFHRLYRQRNLILHGGQIDSVTLAASLRTVSKLAGAGIDRITHAQYVQSLRPLELVARANLSIALVNPQSALSCVDLLELN